MLRSQKGLVHLTAVFVLALLLLATTWVASQRTQSRGLASELPQNYFGIVRKNNFFDCSSGYHLVNLEEDEVAHCLISGSKNKQDLIEALGQFVNQNVKIYGRLSEVNGQRYLTVQSIEKGSGFSLIKNRVMDVLGAFIKRVIAR